jgi:hypothetical protein
MNAYYTFDLSDSADEAIYGSTAVEKEQKTKDRAEQDHKERIQAEQNQESVSSKDYINNIMGDLNDEDINYKLKSQKLENKKTLKIQGLRLWNE